MLTDKYSPFLPFAHLGGTALSKVSVLRGSHDCDPVAFSVPFSKKFRSSGRSKAGVRDGNNHGMGLVGDLNEEYGVCGDRINCLGRKKGKCEIMICYTTTTPPVGAGLP